VVYRGTVPGQPMRFVLDKHHVTETGKVFPVCGNSWKMLAESRFARHFEFIGDFSRHFGIFAGCGTTLPFDAVAAEAAASAGCC
jgi:arsenite methyltransferase